MAKSWYMHTIDGKPAYFDGRQIVFFMRHTNRKQARLLVGSLREIRQQQAASRRQRRAWGIKDVYDRLSDYDYIRWLR